MVERWAAEQGGPTLLFSRLVPVISFNLINYAAGLTAISWWTFTWATGVGILPLTLLMVLMGDGIWSGDSNVWLWLVIGAVAGFAEGWLDIPFSASRHAQSDILPMRDAQGAVRFRRSGGLRFSQETLARNQALLDRDGPDEGGSLFRRIHRDVMFFAADTIGQISLRA